VGPDFAGNGFDFVDEAQVGVEVLASEAGVGLAPVIVGQVVDRADRAGGEASHARISRPRNPLSRCRVVRAVRVRVALGGHL
jgi:hypothetical protein